MSLAKSSTLSSNLGKQPGMSMAPSYHLTDSDVLLWYGFQMLQSEHVLGQDPRDSIYFGPLIFSIQSYRVFPRSKKQTKKRNLALVLIVTTSRYIT